MKKYAFFLLLLVMPVVGFSQGEGSSSFAERIGYLKIGDIDGEFKKSLVNAAKALDQCSAQSNKCDLTDPVKNKKSKAIVQIEKGWSWGASQSAMSQKNMASFEKQVYKNKDNQVLGYTEVEWTFKKHPGYSYEAMENRMKLYILSMESVDDDE